MLKMKALSDPGIVIILEQKTFRDLKHLKMGVRLGFMKDAVFSIDLVFKEELKLMHKVLDFQY